MLQVLKRLIIGLLIICAFVAIFLYSQLGPIIMNKHERVLSHEIKSHLEKPHNWVLVSEIYKEPWSMVCVDGTKSLGNMLSRETISKKFKIPVSELDLPYGLKRASMRNSLIMFYAPPSSVYMFRITNGYLYAHGGRPKLPDEEPPICHKREEAVFLAGKPIENQGKLTKSFSLTYGDAIGDKK